MKNLEELIEAVVRDALSADHLTAETQLRAAELAQKIVEFNNYKKATDGMAGIFGPRTPVFKDEDFNN